MPVFATIISPDYLPFAQCLAASIARYHPEMQLHVLVTGSLPQAVTAPMSGMHFYDSSMIDVPATNELLEKYRGYNDGLRWSLKPVFLLHLLSRFEKVVYTDSDIHFYNPVDFIFDALDNHSVLLTPHYAAPDPFEKEEKFMMNFLDGLYNAGFVAVSRDAKRSLEWWTKACLYRTAIDRAKGFFVDQRYLDMILIIDEKAAILRHQGCNIGSWNLESYRRVRQADKSVLINNNYPIVFIHFNHETIRQIQNGNDPLLEPYLETYKMNFAATGKDLEDFIPMLQEGDHKNLLSVVKRKLSLRTRIKSFLFRLAKRI